MSNGRITRPSLLKQIWNNFMKTTFGVEKRIVVGRDDFGNIYYVFEGETRKATKRGYIPGSTMKWEQMPVEWEAWLRGRRRDPPTQDEIERNMVITEAARIRGQELEREREIERRSEAEKESQEFLESRRKQGFKEAQEQRQQLPHDSTLRKTPLPGIKSSNVEGIPGEKTKQYPSYKEYEGYPGEEPKSRRD